VQSVFYGGAVTSGSWFAIAQSIAMTLPTPWFNPLNIFTFSRYSS
jgi:hypothetical protein